MDQSNNSAGNTLVGTVLDSRFQILALLGSGHTGSVYKARHTLMDREIALKILHPDITSEPKALQRFQLEAKVISNLNHPNIVSVHDFGITTQGQAYLVMDFLDGMALSAILAAEKYLAAGRAAQLFVQACEALSHAHSRGVIHRDLKPSNIIVIAKDGEPEKLKLVDFGIAKLLESDAGPDLQLTQTGEQFGSPSYMSPEQCTARELDARSDVYSLGCVMYESLTGTAPFSATTAAEIVSKHLLETAPPFKSAAPYLSISDGFESIVRKAMAKSKDQRYQSANDLKSALEGQIQVESPAGAGEPGSKQGQRTSTIASSPQAVLIALFIALMIALTGASAWLLSPPGKLLLLQLQYDTLNATVTGSDPGRFVIGLKLLKEYELQHCTKQAAELSLNLVPAMLSYYGKDWQAIAEFYAEAAVLQHQQGNDGKAKEQVELAYKGYDNVLVKLTQAQPPDYPGALVICEKKVQLAKNVFGPESTQAAAALLDVGRRQTSMTQPDKARSTFLEALRIYRKHEPPNSPDIGECYYNLGWVEQSDAKYADAIRYYELALDILKQNGMLKRQRWPLEGMFDTYSYTNQYERTDEVINRRLQLEAILRYDDRVTAGFEYKAACFYLRRGMLDKAERLFVETLTIFASLRDWHEYYAGDTMKELVTMYEKQKRTADIVDLFRNEIFLKAFRHRMDLAIHGGDKISFDNMTRQLKTYQPASAAAR